MFSFTTTWPCPHICCCFDRCACLSSAFHVCILHKTLLGLGEWMSYLLKPANQIRISKELS